MSIPQLSQDMIRRYASSQSWQRGEAYYHDGYVRRVFQRGNSISAEVEGNDIRPYQVSISFDGEELGAVYCSCPYDYGGCCKHIVATLLVCLRAGSNGFCGSTILKGLAPIHRASNQQIMKPVVMIAKTIEIGKRRHPFGAV